jgi:hypothetical protein
VQKRARVMHVLGQTAVVFFSLSSAMDTGGYQNVTVLSLSMLECTSHLASVIFLSVAYFRQRGHIFGGSLCFSADHYVPVM